VRYIFSEWGLSLPHSSKALAGMGKKVDVTEAKPGDLIFFRSSASERSGVSHVGIVTEVTPRNLRFIHSAVTSGIRYDFLQSEYYTKRFVAIRRILTDE
jgi:cell wall-associated NlpC family hydrolase